MDRFWMVLNEATHYTAFKHAERKHAVAEAKRLASQNIGQSFLVLEAIGRAVVESPISYTEFFDPDLPF